MNQWVSLINITKTESVNNQITSVTKRTSTPVSSLSKMDIETKSSHYHEVSSIRTEPVSTIQMANCQFIQEDLIKSSASIIKENSMDKVEKLNSYDSMSSTQPFSSLDNEIPPKLSMSHIQERTSLTTSSWVFAQLEGSR